MYAYGDPSRRAGTTVKGRIPPSDWADCQKLITAISRAEHIADINWVGQLASRTDDKILFRYRTGDEANSKMAQEFLELKTIVERQLCEHYPELREFSKTSHNKVPEDTSRKLADPQH